jgi:hypothetical protein
MPHLRGGDMEFRFISPSIPDHIDTDTIIHDTPAGVTPRLGGYR